MKVGNYIHYRYRNYLRSGLNIRGKNPPSPMDAFKEQRKELLNHVLTHRTAKQKNNIKTTLEQQLNFFFNPLSSNYIQYGYNDSELQELQNKIMSLCESALGNLSAADIDWDNLSAINVNNVGIGNGALYEEFKKIRATRLGREGQLATTQEAVGRRLKALMDLRKQLSDDLADGSINQQFVTKLNQFEKDYSDIISRLVTTQNGVTTQTSLGSSKVKFSIANNASFIQELQDLIDDTKKMTVQQINGLLGEYIPVLTQAVFQNVAQKGLEDTLQNLQFSQELLIPVLGNNRSHKGLVSSKVITKGVVKGGSNFSTETTVGDSKIKIGSTQDKVDIQLNLPGANGKINASVKNIKSSASKIEVLNGTSSLEFLQDYPNFANHYLNIAAEHPDKQNGPPANQLQRAHDMMKLTIALHALTGGTWGKAQGSDVFTRSPFAEILVINSRGRGKGHYSVYFMRDILQAVAKDLSLIDIEGFNQVTTWKNDYVGLAPWVKNAYARIANLLSQLHSQKLKVSLKTAALP